MSEIVSDPAVAAATPTFLARHHFLLRRLHSLSGIVPVGIFVCMHLFTNFQMMMGDYQHEVEFIHSLPALFILEVSIWLGIGFHAGLGFIYTLGGKVNNARYGYAANLRYTMQRVTGIIALIFIFMHIATLRWRWGIFGIFTPFFVAAPDGHPLATASTAMALQHSAGILILYIIGVFSVCYHWSNGLWTAAITWGLTISVQAQKRWGYICFALFLFLSICSAGAIISSMTYKPTDKDQEAMKAAISDFNAHKPLRESSKKENESDSDLNAIPTTAPKTLKASPKVAAPSDDTTTESKPEEIPTH